MVRSAHPLKVIRPNTRIEISQILKEFITGQPKGFHTRLAGTPSVGVTEDQIFRIWKMVIFPAAKGAGQRQYSYDK